MNVNVDRKSGQVKVTLGKRERDILGEAAGILGRLGKHADYQRATDAAIEVTGVLLRFVPQKELPLETDEQKESGIEPPSGGSETTLSVGVSDLSGAGVQPGGDTTARGRKRSSSPHGIV